MVEKPEGCASCAKRTKSHNVAVDVSEHDEVGLPTLAGVVCHTCWVGDTDGVPPIGDLYEDVHRDEEDSDGAYDDLVGALDFGEMVAVSTPAGELAP